MTRLQEFQRNYENAMSTIRDFMSGQHDHGDRPMSALVKWMIDTEINPYGFLPEDWAGQTTTVEDFSSLLRVISHALYDDGDITFVSVNDSPRIVFENRWDIAADHKLALSQTEKHMEERSNRVRYTVEILDIKPEEFGPLVDAYERKQLRRYFMNDADMHGLEFAVKHYESNRLWNPDWIEEFRAQEGVNDE